MYEKNKYESMATMMSCIVTFLNEMNVTGCDGLVDVAHGLGEPRTPVCLSLVYASCLFIFVSLFHFFPVISVHMILCCKRTVVM